MKTGDLVTGRINSDNRVGIVLKQCKAIGSAWYSVRWSCGMIETIGERSVKVIA